MPISTIGSAGINQAADTTLCTTSGNVGIGTASPGTKLDVSGVIRSAGTTGASSPEVSLLSSGYWTWRVRGDGNDLRFMYDATTGMILNSSGNVGIGTSSPTSKLEVSGADVGIQNNYTNGILTVGVSSGVSSRLQLQGAESIRFTTYSSVWAERMRIDSSGSLLVGTTSSFDSGAICADGGNNSKEPLACRVTQTTNSNQISFRNGNGVVGAITTNGSATAYGTSSDYRLKENIAPMTGALAKVAQLNPVTYNWKVDGEASEGFIAHELQTVVPQCVTGEKDAVDADGNPIYQGIDTSFLVATLTAAIQELKTELDSVKAELAALKGTA